MIVGVNKRQSHACVSLVKRQQDRIDQVNAHMIVADDETHPGSCNSRLDVAMRRLKRDRLTKL